MRRRANVFKIEPMKDDVHTDTAKEIHGRQGPGPYSLAVAAAVCLLYLGFLSRQYNFDGTVFSLWLGQAVHGGHLGNLFHPHHMLYLPLGFAFAKLLALPGIEGGMAVTLQFMDVLIAGITLVLFHLLCFRHTKSRFVSTVVTLLLAFSWSFWYLSVEPEVYILHTLMVVLSVSLLFKFIDPEAPGRLARAPWPAKSILLGVSGALCVLTHITGGLFLLPLALGSFLYLTPKEPGGLYRRLRAGTPPVLLMAATAFLLIAIVYWLGYEITPRAAEQGFLPWLIGLADPDTGLGYEKSYWKLSPDAFKLWLAGMQRNLVGGHEDLLSKASWLSLFRAAALFLYVAGIIIYLVRLPQLLRQQKRVHLLLLSAIIPLCLFTMVWEPQNFELKTALHPLLWLAVAMGITSLAPVLKTRRSKTAVYALLPVLACFLFFHNFYSTVLPGSQGKNNPDLQKAYHIRDHTEPEAVVYLAGVNGGYRMGKIYVLYFSGRRRRVVDWIIGRGERPFPNNLLISLYADRDRSVYVLEELIKEGPALSKLGKNHNIDSSRIKEVFLSLEPELVSRWSESFALYRIHPEKIPPPRAPAVP